MFEKIKNYFKKMLEVAKLNVTFLYTIVRERSLKEEDFDEIASSNVSSQIQMALAKTIYMKLTWDEQKELLETLYKTNLQQHETLDEDVQKYIDVMRLGFQGLLQADVTNDTTMYQLCEQIGNIVHYCTSMMAKRIENISPELFKKITLIILNARIDHMFVIDMIKKNIQEQEEPVQENMDDELKKWETEFMLDADKAMQKLQESMLKAALTNDSQAVRRYTYIIKKLQG
jgi:hypothetical protein